MRMVRAALALATLLAGGVVAAAQDGHKAKLYVVPVAQLMRVDEGVFELDVGKTIDLTNRKILLSIHTVGTGNRMRCCDIRLNGDRVLWNAVGHRFDLKSLRSTKSFVEDKNECFLDLVDLALPKGMRGIATFRLHCI